MNYKEQRQRMVEAQLISRHISNEEVIEVFRKIPREEFVPLRFEREAYADCPLPIGEGQTISQPYMVALMTEALELKKNDRVLEIGTGSGYQTAILAEIAKEVHTIERIAVLSERAQDRLEKLGYQNIYFYTGDGTCGLPQNSPYEAIIVTAGVPHIPGPFLKQLSRGGRLVIPVGNSFMQSLVCVHKLKHGLEEEKICSCVFVPLIGKYGWKE